MQMTVIAEGVENEQQAMFLKGLGCDQVQGFYYSPPLPADEFEKLARGLKPASAG
jgi:EAL domain-containing protein (putative c-di-GMP-specific phosphodiesterase class I)